MIEIIPVLYNLHIAPLTGLIELDRAFSCGAMPRQTVSRPYGPEGNDKLFYQAVGHKDNKGGAKPVPDSSQTIRKPREGRHLLVPQPLPLSSSGLSPARQDISAPMQGHYP